MEPSRPKKILMFAEKNKPANENIVEGLSKEGFHVVLETDREACKRRLLTEYYHLVILPKDFVNQFSKQEWDSYIHHIPKIRVIRNKQYEPDSERVEWLGKYNFLDEVITTNLDFFNFKVKKFFNQEYGEFGWDLTLYKGGEELGDQTLSPLAIYSEIATGDVDSSRAISRSEQLEDLVRKVYYDCSKVWVVLPPLMARDGLAVFETYSNKKTHATLERNLLVIGDKAEVEASVGNQLYFAADTSNGTIHLDKSTTIREFMAVRYLIISSMELGRLSSISARINTGHISSEIATCLLSFYKNNRHNYFRRQEKKIRIFDSLLVWLNIPDSATLLDEITERLEELTHVRELPDGIEASVTRLLKTENAWQINIGSHEFIFDLNALFRAITIIPESSAIGWAASTPGRIALENLLIGQKYKLVIAVDFRKPDIPASGLYNLTLFESELRFALGQHLSVSDQLWLDKQLNDRSPPNASSSQTQYNAPSDGTEEQPGEVVKAILRNILDLYEEANGADDPTASKKEGMGDKEVQSRENHCYKRGDSDHQAAMLVQILARLICIKVPMVNQAKMVCALMLLSNAAAILKRMKLTEKQWPEDWAIDIMEEEKKKLHYKIHGLSVTVTKKQGALLQLLLQSKDHTLTIKEYVTRVSQAKIKVDSDTNTFHKAISDLRIRINAQTGYKVGELLIETLPGIGYCLNTKSPKERK